jgi:putative two-component system response regulator
MSPAPAISSPAPATFPPLPAEIEASWGRDEGPRDAAACFADLEGALARRSERERGLFFSLMRLMSGHDGETGGHCLRVGFIARAVARGLGLDGPTQDVVLLAAPFHDVGKATMITQCDLKPGPLTDEEQVTMRTHAAGGRRLLGGSDAPLLQTAASIAGAHHERWDGRGYPERLAGEAIPLVGRIAAVADVFDALVSERPYKRAWSLDRAADHLIAGAGKHFDPFCVRAFCLCWGEVRGIVAALAHADHAVERFVAANIQPYD